ncbi:MAG: response regulator transcription factor [Chloroflexi bacterium]|nr:response regulator transcription factor [Chloroflexota bacterium]
MATSPTDTKRTTVLVVEDDVAVATALVDLLSARGYAVHHEDNAKGAAAALEEIAPDLVLLDLMLPDGDGLEACAGWCVQHDVPIIVCSGRDQPDVRVQSLKLGADDFVAKPFYPSDVEARVEAVLRRARRARDGAARNSRQREPAVDSAMRVGSLVVDPVRLEVWMGSRRASLTPIEFRLLHALASRSGTVVSPEELKVEVWGTQAGIDNRSLYSHIKRLRAKLAALPSYGRNTPTVHTVRGHGFMLH